MHKELYCDIRIENLNGKGKKQVLIKNYIPSLYMPGHPHVLGCSLQYSSSDKPAHLDRQCAFMAWQQPLLITKISH